MRGLRRAVVLSMFVLGLCAFAVAGCAHHHGAAKSDMDGAKCGPDCKPDGSCCKAGTCSASKSMAMKKSATDKPAGCELCAKGMAGEPAWCDNCAKGYVDGKAIACKGCYVAKTGGGACATCNKK